MTAVRAFHFILSHSLNKGVFLQYRSLQFELNRLSLGCHIFCNTFDSYPIYILRVIYTYLLHVYTGYWHSFTIDKLRNILFSCSLNTLINWIVYRMIMSSNNGNELGRGC